MTFHTRATHPCPSAVWLRVSARPPELKLWTALPPKGLSESAPRRRPFSLRDSFGLAVGPICCAGRSAPGRRVVVEERYLHIFKLDRIRPAVVADGLAEMQVRWPPGGSIVSCETRRSQRVTLL